MSLETRKKIEMVCQSISESIQEKNIRYGNSALEPLKIFSRADDGNSIKIRLDDKLNRIKNNTEALKKNDVFDLMGYLILLCIQCDWTDFSDQLD